MIEDIYRAKIRSQQLKKISIVDMPKLEEMMFTQYRSGYEFVLVCSMDKSRMKDCIMYQQLKRIHEANKSKGCFKFLCFKNTSRKDQFFAAVQIDTTLMQIYSERLDFRIFNRNRGFYQPYVMFNNKENWEMLRDSQLQKIILHIMSFEFNIFEFEQQKIILEKYPLHDLYRREEIASAFSLWKIIKTSMIRGGPNQIATINSAQYYLGSTLGYLIGFSILLKSWITFYIIFPIVALIIFNIFFSANSADIDLYLILTQMFLVWTIGFVIKYSWMRRLNELNYSWGNTLQPSKNLSRGNYYVNKVTGKITDMNKKTRVIHYLRWNMIILYILTLLPVALTVTLIPYIINLSQYSTNVKSAIMAGYGVVQAIYSRIMNDYQIISRGVYSIFELELIMYLLNYMIILFIFSYAYDLDYFDNYFLGFAYTSIIMHLLLQELVPYLRFRSRIAAFKKNWEVIRAKLIRRFVKKNPEFSIHVQEQSEKFKVFRKELVIKQQIQYN